ncbi:MAG: SGNH/GDSL hydrolase family protein [Candidatus Omnitrophota bacterium]
MNKEFLRRTALVIFSVIFALFLAEAVYRLRVVFFRPSSAPIVSANLYNDSYVVYDPRYGYSYNAAKKIYQVNIENKKAVLCDFQYAINEFGTFETDVTGFKQAQEDTGKRGPRILVFGDSFTSIPYNGETWVSLFSKNLKEKLDPDAQVLNFGRDGYGVLQMLDLAAGQIETWKPDMILFAFITDDLHRRRFWRKIVTKGSLGYWYVAFDPAADENAFDSQLGQLFDRRITKQWCGEVMKHGGEDPLIAPMETFFKEVCRGELKRNIVRFFLPQSFLFNKLVYGEPVIRRSRSQGGRLSFLNDPGLKTAINRLNRSKVPYYFVHLPMLPEMEKNVRWLPSTRDLRLARELISMIGPQRLLFLGDYLHLSTEQLALFPMSPQDGHPSKDGIRYIADAMVKLYADMGKNEQRKANDF